MDRNTLIATVLITGIMIAWMYLITPPPPPPLPQGAVADSSALVDEAPAEPDSTETATTELTRVPADAVEGEDRLVVVDTDLYTATFSTRGGTIVSFTLKEYSNAADRTSPVQLIEPGQKPFGFSFGAAAGGYIDARRLYFATPAPSDTLFLSGQDTLALAFTATLGEGQLTQTYTLRTETYDIGWQLSRTNAAAFEATEGYEIFWDHRLPFAEESAEEELRRGGAYARGGGSVEYATVLNDTATERTLNGAVDWIAVRNKYFAAIIIPTRETRSARLEASRDGDLAQPGVDAHFSAHLEMAAVPATEIDRYRLFLGPMEYRQLAAYRLGLYDMVDYGWDAFEWITRPVAKFFFIPYFDFMGRFMSNYGLIIILFAFLIKVLTHPLQRAQFRSMAKMRLLQPKMEEIKAKHKDDPQKQQEAMMRMYRESGVNPLGGCLPMLLQYPILIALWMYLPQSMEIRQQAFLWASDLSAPDPILMLPFTIPFYGNFVAGFTLLMGLSLVVQMRIQMKSQPSNPTMQVFMYVLPVMLFMFFNKQASGLSLYYLCYNVFTALQQWWINREFPTTPVAEPAHVVASAPKSDVPKHKRETTPSPSRKNKK